MPGIFFSRARRKLQEVFSQDDGLNIGMFCYISSLCSKGTVHSQWSLGEQEMLWEHEPQAIVSTAFFSSPKLIIIIIINIINIITILLQMFVIAIQFMYMCNTYSVVYVWAWILIELQMEMKLTLNTTICWLLTWGK